ncbi:MAG: helix-turn-helix domain-containing protein [Spirochaetales bacterium]|nr:helix-turn-helix domain-containing protein [Spirochaetales bacterium]
MSTETKKSYHKRIPEGCIDNAEAAKILGVHPQTLRNWVRKGEVPFVRSGRNVFFRPEKLRAWLEAREFEPVTPAISKSTPVMQYTNALEQCRRGHADQSQRDQRKELYRSEMVRERRDP